MYTEVYSREQLEAQSSFIAKVYGWMAFAMGITAFTALYTASSQAMKQLVFGTSGVFLGLLVAEFLLVMAISWLINKISAGVATGLFMLYSLMNGLTLAVIFMVYTSASIASTFFATGAMFAAMSLYGYTTKRDLTSWGNILFMGLIGIIIASVVNMFFYSELLYWVISYLGVLIFVGLTAYDTQKLKAMSLEGFSNSETQQKGAIMGALTLYLDFVNLFLFLLRLMGRRR